MIKNNTISTTNGFTLLEILIALFIFAIVGVIASSGLRSVLKDQEVSTRKSTQLAQLQLAIIVIERDLMQIVNRSVRVENGELLPALIANENDQPSLQFTHAGYINPQATRHQSTLQRVRYRLSEGKLLRETWPMLDRTSTQEPDAQVLLTGVQSMTFEFLDTNHQYQTIIPVPTQPGQQVLPLAIRMRFDSDIYGHVVRLIPLVNA